MPWCGTWGAASGAYWWILPLIGLLFMGVMFFACIRGFGFGCIGRRGTSDEIARLQREIDGLKASADEDLHQPR
jgi:hypothetical protein